MGSDNFYTSSPMPRCESSGNVVTVGALSNGSMDELRKRTFDEYESDDELKDDIMFPIDVSHMGECQVYFPLAVRTCMLVYYSY